MGLRNIPYHYPTVSEDVHKVQTIFEWTDTDYSQTLFHILLPVQDGDTIHAETAGEEAITGIVEGSCWSLGDLSEITLTVYVREAK